MCGEVFRWRCGGEEWLLNGVGGWKVDWCGNVRGWRL